MYDEIYLYSICYIYILYYIYIYYIIYILYYIYIYYIYICRHWDLWTNKQTKNTLKESNSGSPALAKDGLRPRYRSVFLITCQPWKPVPDKFSNLQQKSSKIIGFFHQSPWLAFCSWTWITWCSLAPGHNVSQLELCCSDGAHWVFGKVREWVVVGSGYFDRQQIQAPYRWGDADILENNHMNTIWWRLGENERFLFFSVGEWKHNRLPQAA